MTIAAWETNYIALLGSIDGAVFLSQLIYWQKTMKGRWFYKTGESWQQEIGLSRYRRESLCKQLIGLGILSTKREGVPPRTYYNINFEQLMCCLDALPEMNTNEASKQTLPDVLPEMINPAEALDATAPTHSDTTQAHKNPANQLATQSPIDLPESLSLNCDSAANQNAAQQPFEWSESIPLKCHSVTNQLATGQHVDLSLASKLNGHPATNQFATEPPYISMINTKINTKITHKINTIPFVKFEDPTTSHSDFQHPGDGQLSATEKPKQQTEKSGNSPPAARRGGGEPESLNQSSQIIQADDVAHQETTDVGAYHLQCIQENLALAKKADNRVVDIFLHWQTVMSHPNAKLDGKRKRLINAALKMGYTADELKQAIDGCGQTPHNLGDNDRGQRYDGLHIILRDADQIDRFVRNAVNPPKKMNAQEQLEAENKRVTEAWLYQQGLSPVGETIINSGEL